MNILVYSPVFAPSVGGLEFMAGVLAGEFAELGHAVRVATRTPGDPVCARYEVVRRPSPAALLRHFRWADVILQMNLSLKGLWPFAFVRRPLVAGHFGLYRRDLGRIGLRDRLKFLAARWAHNVACSQAVKADLPASTLVVGNCYDDGVFSDEGRGQADRDVVFVGRLVSEKGADLLLDAVARLRDAGRPVSVSIVGGGPEAANLEAQRGRLRLQDEVEFHGVVKGGALAALLRRHVVLAVPSRNEGFGVVALEGMACGCVVAGSDAGGLLEAIGGGGLVFPSGDSAGLARALEHLLDDAEVRQRCLAARKAHLARHARRAVALRYLEVMERAVAGAGSGR